MFLTASNIFHYLRDVGLASAQDIVDDGFTVRDLAWHAEKGLWGLSYDPLNDEWGLMTLGVADWTRADNRIESVRYAFKYGDVKDPATDACYWRQSMTGLEFVGDTVESLRDRSSMPPMEGMNHQGMSHEHQHAP